MAGCPAPEPKAVVYDLVERLPVAERWSSREVILFGTPAAPLIRDLNGLSEESYNATLYYDDQTLMIRLSYAYRDQYQRAATSLAGNDLVWT